MSFLINVAETSITGLHPTIFSMMYGVGLPFSKINLQGIPIHIWRSPLGYTRLMGYILYNWMTFFGLPDQIIR